MDLFTKTELPKHFSYPLSFLRTVDRGLTYLEPWFVLEGSALRERAAGLRERYPTRLLVPFARREDNDDVACWDTSVAGEVVVIHDFASPGFEQRQEFSDFYAWLRAALDAMIEFDRGEDPPLPTTTTQSSARSACGW